MRLDRADRQNNEKIFPVTENFDINPVLRCISQLKYSDLYFYVSSVSGWDLAKNFWTYEMKVYSIMAPSLHKDTSWVPLWSIVLHSVV